MDYSEELNPFMKTSLTKTESKHTQNAPEKTLSKTTEKSPQKINPISKAHDKTPPTNFKDRKRLLEKACSQYFLRTKHEKIKYNAENSTDLIAAIAYQIPRKIVGFDVDNRIMYCFLPKAGTTNWSTLAGSIKRNLTVDGYVNLMKSRKDEIYHELEKAQFLMKQHVMNPLRLDYGEKFQGVLLTRHPLTRLYSAWSHRLSNSEPSHEKMFNALNLKRFNSNGADSKTGKKKTKSERW